MCLCYCVYNLALFTSQVFLSNELPHASTRGQNRKIMCCRLINSRSLGRGVNMKKDGCLWKAENDLIYSSREQIYLAIRRRGGKSNTNFVVTYAKPTFSSVDHN